MGYWVNRILILLHLGVGWEQGDLVLLTVPTTQHKARRYEKHHRQPVPP